MYTRFARAAGGPGDATVIGSPEGALPARRQPAQRLPDHRGHDLRHLCAGARPHHPRGGAAGAGDRRARPPGRQGAARRDRDRGRGRGPGGGCHRLHRRGPAGLAHAGHRRAVRRRCRGRQAARPDQLADAQRAGARRQPVRRDLGVLGHADGQVPSVARRRLRAAGRPAGRAGLRRLGRDPGPSRRRHPCRLLERRRPVRRGRRPRATVRVRAHLAAAVAGRHAAAADPHRDVRAARGAPAGIRRRSSASASRWRRTCTRRMRASPSPRARSMRCSPIRSRWRRRCATAASGWTRSARRRSAIRISGGSCASGWRWSPIPP